MKALIICGVMAVLLSACGNNEPQTTKPATSEPQVTKSQPQPEPQPDETTTVSSPVHAEDAAAVNDEEVQTQTVASDEEIKAAMAALPADAGQKRYEATCKICHDQGLLEAPKKGDKAAWQARIAKGKDTLYQHSSKGFNKMPAQATGDVSEAEVRAAVDYLIDQSL